MDKKTFAFIRMVTAFIVAMLCAIAVVRGNYILPIIVGVSAAIFVYAMKKQVSGVLADERDYQVAGVAARWSLNVYCILAAIASMILMATRAQNPQFELAAQIFAYSACGLLITQSLLFKYFNRTNG